MASGGSNDCNSQLNDSIDKSKSRKHSSEHEETIKSDQMAAKKFDEKPHIEDFDETQLKSLLDEAMDYKNPRDANDKSDTFKQLLKNVTEEDMKRSERYNLGNFGIKQSNSLQNLLDESHYQSSSHQSHTSSKKHHQQRRKNSTSVSARRLEGGSLPIDMHHSSSAVQSPPDQPFLSEIRKKKEKQQRETVIDIGENDTDEKKLMQQRHWDCNKDSISSSSYPYDGIEMQSMSYTNTVDLEVQDMSRYSAHTHPTITTISSITPAGGPPIATASIINPKVTSSAVATSSTMHSVDKIIEFPSLIEKGKMYQQQQQQLIDVYSPGIHSNNIVVANHELTFSSSTAKGFSGLDALPLNPCYNSVTSLTNNEKASAKTYMNKQSNHDTNSVNSLIQTAPMISAAHQPGSAANSKEAKSKAKRAKAQERNEKTIDVQMIDGFRGTDKVEDLLRYIEDGGKEQHKGHPKNGIVSSHQTSDHLLSAEEKKKKMAAKNKEKVNKLKKSNSMDELCSTGRQEQQQEEKSSTTAANKIIEDVTLRSKSSNLTSGAKKGDKNEKSQHKRNERRSWGTEGLWTEATPAAEQSRDNQEEHQEVESSSSSTSSGVPSEHITDPIASIEPATAVVSETEFHVVTKKRKVKRKASEGADLGKASNHLQSYNMKREGNNRPGTKHYNDRGEMGPKTPRNSKPLNQDAKVSTGKNRRKSTSSMPPSDDDWNSDGGDSVQSLPIETTKTTSSQLLSTAPVVNEATSSSGGKSKKNANPSHQQHHQKPATFSYADIAKTNANRNSGTNVTTSTEKWPSITASSSSSTTTTHQNNNDPFSIANFDAAVSNSMSNPKSQQQHQKSAAPITTSMMSFPELVESNNNKNKQLSSNPSSSSLENALNGETINTTEKPLNGLDTPRAFDNNNNNNNNSNAVVADDRLNNNNQKISYSQSLLENNHQEVDSNGNNVKTEIINGPIGKATLTKSKSVDHNNLSSIEHYPALEKTQATLGEVFNSKSAVTFETYASKSKQKQLKPELKPTKKDKLKKSLSVQSPQFPQQNAILNCRPAVIILNDCTKPTDADCGITFGFDINEHLLFGQQNGDDAGCLTDVSLETNNNNNCDITNTNLSSNNLTNQPCIGVEMYEQFIAPQNIIIGSSEGHIIALSQSSPQSHALDSSNQSSNDMGYLSSSLITNSMSPATRKSSSSMPNDEHHDVQEEDAELQRIPMELKRVANSEVHQLVLPQFILPGPVKFNQEELVSFVSDEWTKFIRNGVYFNDQ